MSKNNKSILKKFLYTLLTLVFLIIAFGFWLFSLLPSSESTKGLKSTLPEQLEYISQNKIAHRGKILTVVTSADRMGNSEKKTGYELTELSRAYYVFTANGFEVDIASPLGGGPPVIIDSDDMGPFDFAFLNDSVAQYKVQHSLLIDNIQPEDYEAVYFVGGKGAMYDFPENQKIQTIVKDYYEKNKVIGAVCHGPAALVNVTLDNGEPIIKGKTISSFTNEEELFLIPDAKDIFPFLLQDKLEAQGASFDAGPRYLKQVSLDGNLVTGQNPWSTWALAEAMIVQLGYVAKARKITPEENTVTILSLYEASGYQAAKESLKIMMTEDPTSIERNLLGMHGVVEGMDWNIRKSYDLIRLLSYAKNLAD